NLVFNVPTATPGDTVQLFRNGALVGTNVGPGSITDPGPIQPDGVYVYTTQQVDQFGTISLPSAPLNVTILSKAAAPTQVRLNPTSDTGTQGDNTTRITSNLMLDILGVLPGATVHLFNNGVEVASVTSLAGGKVTLVDSGPLAPATYKYTATQVDAAGNPSAASPVANVQIITTPTIPVLALDP